MNLTNRTRRETAAVHMRSPPAGPSAHQKALQQNFDRFLIQQQEQAEAEKSQSAKDADVYPNAPLALSPYEKTEGHQPVNDHPKEASHAVQDQQQTLLTSKDPLDSYTTTTNNGEISSLTEGDPKLDGTYSFEDQDDGDDVPYGELFASVFPSSDDNTITTNFSSSEESKGDAKKTDTANTLSSGVSRYSIDRDPCTTGGGTTPNKEDEPATIALLPSQLGPTSWMTLATSPLVASAPVGPPSGSCGGSYQFLEKHKRPSSDGVVVPVPQPVQSAAVSHQPMQTSILATGAATSFRPVVPVSVPSVGDRQIGVPTPESQISQASPQGERTLVDNSAAIWRPVPHTPILPLPQPLQKMPQMPPGVHAPHHQHHPTPLQPIVARKADVISASPPTVSKMTRVVSNVSHPPRPVFTLPSTVMPPTVLASVCSSSVSSTASSQQGRKRKTSSSLNKKKKRIAIPTGGVSPQALFETLARQHGHTLKRLSTEEAEYDATPSALQLASFGTKLVQAVHTTNVSLLKELMSCGLSPNPCNQFRDGLLDLVCKRANTDIFQCLLDCGCDLKVVDGFGRTPLHHACWASAFCQPIVEAILDRDPVQLCIADRHGQTPLEYVRADLVPDWVDFLNEKLSTWYPPGGLNSPTWVSPRKNRPDGKLRDPSSAVMSVDLATQVSAGGISPSDVLQMDPKARENFQSRD